MSKNNNKPAICPICKYGIEVTFSGWLCPRCGEYRLLVQGKIISGFYSVLRESYYTTFETAEL
jgi:hypothetical protein